MVGALNVERANDCERSFTPPIGETWSNVDRNSYAFGSIHDVNLFSFK
jgi:hypothetical protein